MKSAIQTLIEGLTYCENYLKDHPNCSGQSKRIKAQQIVEHKRAILMLQAGGKIIQNLSVQEHTLLQMSIVDSLKAADVNSKKFRLLKKLHTKITVSLKGLIRI